MLIYARNQTFCSKSVNKAPKILILGLNILCGILSNYIKINFLCILLFYEFLMYFLVFFRVKISIFIWTMWKISICIDFVHKITFWSHFRSDVHVQKITYIQNRTPANVSRRELCALQSNRAKCRGGGGGLLGPPVFLGLTEIRWWNTIKTISAEPFCLSVIPFIQLGKSLILDLPFFSITFMIDS